MLVALGLGSNQGDRAAHLQRAIAALRRMLGPLRAASLYRSSALPSPTAGSAQGDYLNTAVLATIDARRRPQEVLTIAKALELAAGRRRGPRWGPRPLDVDLLLFGTEVCRRPELTVPHPGLRSRAFVLQPLAELDPDLPLPGDGPAQTVGAALAALGSGARALPVAPRAPI